MRRALLITACLVALPLLAAAQTYTASLTADAVVPNPGPAGATGFATVSFSGTDAAYSILVSGVGGLTAAHIHEGAAGASGPIVVDFAATFTGGNASGSVAVDAETVAAIVSDPAGYYVQVHSSEFPAGAVRGQLVEKQHPPLADGEELAVALRRQPALLDVRERPARERDRRERDLGETLLDVGPPEARDRPGNQAGDHADRKRLRQVIAQPFVDQVLENILVHHQQNSCVDHQAQHVHH